MAKRKVQTVTVAGTNVAAVIRWDTEYREYSVVLVVDGKALPESEYFTDSRLDAEGTANVMVADYLSK